MLTYSPNKSRKKPKGELISVETINASLVHPREVFRPAIKYNSTEIIILHNHPSDDVSPSEADIEVTERIKNAGQLCWLYNINGGAKLKSSGKIS